MISFIKRILIFFVLIVALAYAFDYMITEGLHNANLRKFQAWNDLYDSNIDEDVVIVGNSRAWSQYDVKILDSIVGLSFYNLGIDGHPIDYQVIKYNTYRRFNKKPRYVIQNIDFFTLALSKDAYEREQFFPYVKDDTLMDLVAKHKNLSWIDINVPFVRYYGYRDIIESGIQSFFGKKNFFDGGMYKGYRGNIQLWDGEEFIKLKPFKYSKDSIALNLFEKYLQKCKDEQIQVILVSAPIFRSLKDKIIDYNKMNRFYNTLAERYNCKILDYTTESMCLDTTFFINATHLNKSGAEQFTYMLAKDLKNILK